MSPEYMVVNEEKTVGTHTSGGPRIAKTRPNRPTQASKINP